MGQVRTHVWVEEEGYKRRVKGKGRGGRGGGGSGGGVGSREEVEGKWRGRGGRSCMQHWLRTVDINGNHERSKDWVFMYMHYTVISWYHPNGVYGEYCCDNCMLVGIMYNPEDTCKTMSLHVIRLNASLPHTHPLAYYMYIQEPVS